MLIQFDSQLNENFKVIQGRNPSPSCSDGWPEWISCSRVFPFKKDKKGTLINLLRIDSSCAHFLPSAKQKLTNVRSASVCVCTVLIILLGVYL